MVFYFYYLMNVGKGYNSHTVTVETALVEGGAEGGKVPGLNTE